MCCTYRREAEFDRLLTCATWSKRSNLEHNQLEGSIPSSIGRAKSLQQLYACLVLLILEARLQGVGVSEG